MLDTFIDWLLTTVDPSAMEKIVAAAKEHAERINYAIVFYGATMTNEDEVVEYFLERIEEE